MRVLLVGEFSGFHNNLKKGLQRIGCEVVLACSGDGFKNLPFDINIGSNKAGIPGTIQRIFRALRFVVYAKGFDVVQFVNPNIFPGGFGLNNLLIKLIIKRNKKTCLAACGDDYAFIKYGCHNMRYNPITDSLRYDFKADTHPLDNLPAKKWWTELVSKIDAVIPVMHEYELGYKASPKLKPCIPLPVDIAETAFVDMPATEVITILHGDNRYGFKGTRFVEEAFVYLREKYPTQLELVIAGKLPLPEYLALMRRSHIVVDQTNSYSCGMNALYAMAMGKVVLGGAEPEGLVSLGVEESPVINITPSAQSIIDAVETLLANRSQLVELGLASRKFIENYHCSVKIAEKYLDAWRSI